METGLNGQAFGGDARRLLAQALTEAEKETNGGVLKLVRWRADKTENVELKLQVLGTYAPTAPCGCAKSKRIFEQGCEAIAKRGFKDKDGNGKCSGAAVIFDLLGDREAAAFYSRMGTAAYSEWESGHTGNFFNIFRALPGCPVGRRPFAFARRRR